jgi:hypothetical protein
MEQGNNRRNENRATFAEVFGSIRFAANRSANAEAHWPEPGFADNRSQHAGVAAPDDYKKLVLSTN